MIARIIDLSARHRAAVVLVTLAGAFAGWWSLQRVPLDALPDLSDTQVIVYSQWDRSPDVIEDQVTYPIVTALVGAPHVKAVRGVSDFGASFVYVVFEDGTDIYWARSRTLEYLSAALSRLPQGVRTELGPDATGLGWVYQYAVVDESGTHSPADLRSYQDWYLRSHLKSVRGVAEVASVGGYVRQYQIAIDPNRLRARGIPLARVVDAVRGGNDEAGGRLIEVSGTEYMVRGRGYARSVEDFENIALSAGPAGAPIRIKDVGQVVIGPDIRRGTADLDGRGETVSGIVIMRHGENALAVIERVRAKLADVQGGLPAGIKVVPIYDRSQLIQRSVDNLKWTLVEIMITVGLVILLFLWHIPSALIPIVTIPVAVLIAFIPFRAMGFSANIMSLGGIAIAVGALVDASIVVVEQTHKKLEIWNRTGRREDQESVIVSAVKEVGGPSFFALLVIAVSFLPVLTLEAQEGRLFTPLAYTKTLCMVVAAVLAITLDPALRLLLMRYGRIRSEERHPISRALMRLYAPVAAWALRRPGVVLSAAGLLIVATMPIAGRLGAEFMPPLDEGTIFYMPTTMPGISIGDAQRLLQATDRTIKQFPEVDRVLGKAGRAETATDPAPLSMLETVVILKPRSEWRRVPRWYSSWAPEWSLALFRRVTSDRISQEQLVAELDKALTLPGVSNAWTMPVKARTAMLATGIRTPIGLKITGPDLHEIDRIGGEVRAALTDVRGTRNVFAERTGGGYFLDVAWKRDELARAGLGIGDAQMVVQNAIGGENLTTTVEGRARYPVNVRYAADFRSDFAALGQLPVTAADGQRQIPLSQLAAIVPTTGPAMIRNEDGLLTAYVYVDLAGRDPGSYLQEARSRLAAAVPLPPGYAMVWSGQYEAMARVRARLTLVIPLTLACIVLLLYMNTGSFVKTAMVLLAVPFSAVGAIWFLYALGYNMSIAVWVGLIALVGVDAETGVFMLLYLDLAYERAKADGRLRNRDELRQAIMQGAVTRLRPKFMTVATMFLGLVPIMWATGTGADVMKRIAAPLIGGLLTSFILELIIYPPIYQLWKWHGEVKAVSEKTATRDALARAVPIE
jgi:Cu(I)/Ag(I) efflux system membrane protein CusA/SilA